MNLYLITSIFYMKWIATLEQSDSLHFNYMY